MSTAPWLKTQQDYQSHMVVLWLWLWSTRYLFPSSLWDAYWIPLAATARFRHRQPPTMIPHVRKHGWQLPWHSSVYHFYPLLFRLPPVIALNSSMWSSNRNAVWYGANRLGKHGKTTCDSRYSRQIYQNLGPQQMVQVNSLVTLWSGRDRDPCWREIWATQWSRFVRSFALISSCNSTHCNGQVQLILWMTILYGIQWPRRTYISVIIHITDAGDSHYEPHHICGQTIVYLQYGCFSN